MNGHIFICLLLRRINIEMPHTKTNKKKRKYADYHIFIFKENTGWPIKKKNYSINHESIYNYNNYWLVFCAIRINCWLMTSVSWSTGNQVFLLLKLQIPKWHTSYPAWWRSAGGQHTVVGTGNIDTATISLGRECFCGSHNVQQITLAYFITLFQVNEGNTFLVLWIFKAWRD